ncbi:MAG TPA: lipopolysaccharide assembly protein LapA domain-containing protein [Amycolatopsis sp.]|nr:lipopolysaccharide assembly protein LapA domain-containing protein [Amycolatopsis sp.]
MTHAQEGEPAEVPREPTTPTSTGTPPKPLKHTRISGTWVAVIVALIVLVFLLIFILNNLDSVTVTFLGMTGNLPLAVAMLLSAVGGALLVALIGAARIMQLRRATRKAHKALR